MDKREFVRHIKELLNLDDFKAVGVGAGSVSLVRGNEEIIISYNKYPGQYLLPPALSGRKSFKEVEDILDRYYKKYGIGLRGDTIHMSSRRLEDLDQRTIRAYDDFSKVLPHLKTMVYEDILPFFDKYQDIHQVYDEIESLEKSQISRFIYHPPTIRMMIIKRLVNDPNWEEFAMGVVTNYKEWAEESNGIIYKPYADFLPELYVELQNINPIR